MLKGLGKESKDLLAFFLTEAIVLTQVSVSLCKTREAQHLCLT